MNKTTWNKASNGGSLTWTIDATLTTVLDLNPRRDSVSWDYYPGAPMIRLGDVESHSILSVGKVDLNYDPTYPLQPLKVKTGTGCIMNPCLRRYTVSLNAGSLSVESSIISEGIVATFDATYNVPNDAFFPPYTQETYWVSDYTLLSDADAATDNWSLSRNTALAHCMLGNAYPNCKLDTRYLMCRPEALQQTRAVLEVITDKCHIDLRRLRWAESDGRRPQKRYP